MRAGPSYGEVVRPFTRLSIVPLGILLAATLTAAPASADPAEEYAETAHQVTNKVRSQHDRTRLKPDACLTRFANRQADRMAKRRAISHQPLRPVLRACGLRMAGENVAYGFASGHSVVRRGWMKSPGHRENILRPQYRLMGIGAERGRDGAWYVAQVFGTAA
jgi:uncharacterized protein YkwD